MTERQEVVGKSIGQHMSKNKLERFRDNELRDNVIQPGKAIFDEIKGNWREKVFGNNNPITLEVGCGKGDYTVGLARKYPNENFIGIDVKGARIWVGSGKAIQENLANAAFLRIRILDIEHFFCENEVDRIWLPFPDPRPRQRDVRRRITNSRFLDMYKHILKPGGLVQLKTDNTQLYYFTKDVLETRGDVEHVQFTDNLYHSYLQDRAEGIITDYEARFLEMNNRIKYIEFRFSE